MINYDGMWNVDASNEFSDLFNKEENTPKMIHEHFFVKAIINYKRMKFKIIPFYFNKSYILTDVNIMCQELILIV